ncbi:MAG: hypothetical protein ACI4A7_01745 [Prevotella sp.]
MEDFLHCSHFVWIFFDEDAHILLFVSSSFPSAAVAEDFSVTA